MLAYEAYKIADSAANPEIHYLEASFLWGESKGEFLGKTVMAREICAWINPHWPNSRVKATACVLGESKGRIGAYNDNYRDGFRTSRDCGLFQNNIDDSLIDTPAEARLRTESFDPIVYEPVIKANVKWAYNLWSARTIIRDGKLDYRRWSPWVAYTTGWAMFPMLYAWHREDGVPAGPWVESGRYLHKAIRGVVNWHLLIEQSMDSKEALQEAERLAHQYGVPETCAWKYTNNKAVYFIPPPKPTAPPDELTNYGYPKHNNGV